MKKRHQEILQHVAPEELEFAEKMMDTCRQVEESYAYRLTSFLNPRQEVIVRAIAASFQLQIYSSQDIFATEYRRLIVAPAYYELQVDDFEIQLLEVDYPRKFYHLSHAQVLGSLLNQLGVRREVLGDILVREDALLVLLDRTFATITQQEITKLSRVPVKWLERNWLEAGKEEQSDGVVEQHLLVSLRLDVIIAAVFRISRTKVSKLIDTQRVKVDYAPATQAGKVLEMGQLISVRGFGRIRLKEISGHSKRDKLKVEMDVIRK